MYKTAFLVAALAFAGMANADYTQKYDSTFGVGVAGIYGFSSKSTVPGVGGGYLSFFNYMETGTLVHQISLNVGFMGGHRSKSIGDFSKYTHIVRDGRAKMSMTQLPIMVGYDLLLPISQTVRFYVGAKVGVSYQTANLKAYETAGNSWKYKHDGLKFAFTGELGFKFSVAKHVDLFLGYEYLYIADNAYKPAFHCIKAGADFTF